MAAALALTLSMLGIAGAPPASADPVSPLTVTQTASPSPVASGSELTYTTTIVNTGGAKVTNAVLTDQIAGVGGIGTPPQLVLTSSKGTCTQSSLKVSCAIGDIVGGGTVTVTIRGVVTAASGTTLNNTVSVTGTKSAQNFTTTSTVSTLVQGGGTGGTPMPDLTISKTGPSSVAVNDPVKWVLTVNNSGDAPANDVKVVDTLPAGVTAATATGTSLFACSTSGSPITVTCSGGRINAGTNATITINATAPATTGTLANTAVVDPDNTIAERNDNNNTSATVSTSVTSAPAPQGLTITNADSPDPVTPGSTLTYTIVVKNISATRADDVVTVDGTHGLEAASITASQVVVNGSAGKGTCVVNAPQVTCSLKSLNAGGTQTITIRGQVTLSAGSTILNTATGTANVSNTGVSATATAQTVVKPYIDLSITKADSPDPVCAGSWPNGTHLPSAPDGLSGAGGSVPTLLAAPGCLDGLTYTLVVGNSGIHQADNVTVRDALPSALTFDSYSTDGGFTCAVDASKVVTCTGGTVGPESTKQIKLRMAVGQKTGTIDNTAVVDPNNAIYEADETNNTDSQSTTIGTGVNLVVKKYDEPGDPPGAATVTDGFDPIATSGTETYTIVVDNVGTQDATGIRVRDILPSGSRFISVDPDSAHGFTCAHDGAPTGGNVECTNGRLLGTQSEFYDQAGPAPAGPGDDVAIIKVRVFAQPNDGIMHNEVRVDPLNDIAEYDESDNIATQDTTVTNGGATLNAFNELSVEKTQVSPASGTSVATNGTLKYTIKVTNDGTDPAVGVHVRDFLPTGAKFVEATDEQPGPDAFHCTQAGGQIDCTGGTLDGTLDLVTGVGQTRTIDVTVFAPNTPGTYKNQAIVDPDNVMPEGNEFNNVSTVTTKVTTTGSGGQNAFNELTITNTQTDPPGNVVATSSVVTYQLTVANTGTDPAFGVVVKDTLPAGFTFDSAVEQSGPSGQKFVCSASGQVITCSGATLSGTDITVSGAPTTRTITVQAHSSAVPGTYVDTAVVDPDNTIAEGDETNNTAQVNTKVLVGSPTGYIDLKMKVDAAPAPKVVPGGTITYTLTVTNAGTNPAFQVRVRDDLPAGTTFVSAVDTLGGAGAFSCSVLLGTTVTCTGGTLDGTSPDDLVPGVGNERTITIKVLAPKDIRSLAANLGDISADIVDQAFVDPDNAIGEADETNNAGSATTTVRSKINLRVTKDGPTTASQNTEADYKIKVYNEDADGDGVTAFGVELVDPLPVGLIPLSVTTDPSDSSNFRCEIQENPVNRVYCIGDLGPENPPSGVPDTHIATITVHVFVTANGGSLDNEACVDPSDTISEQNETDNCVHKITDVVPPAPDLLINKSADASVVTSGQDLAYKLTVSNVGTADATGTVTITDPLPSAVTLVNATATNGFTCSGTTTVTCTGSGLAKGQSTVVTVLTKVGDGLTAPFTNTATVAAVAGETSTANNSASVTTSVGGSGLDLQVSSINDAPDPVNIGDALTYTITVNNNGTSTAGTVADPAQVRVDLPANGVTLVSAAGSNGFGCTQIPPTLTCSGVLAGGGSTVITVKLAVVTGTPPTLALTATADPTGAFTESDEGNNTLTETTTVSGTLCTSPCIDLVAAQVIGSPNPVKDGTPETFTFHAVNAGDQTTVAGSNPNAQVDLLLFGDFTSPTAPSAPGWSCTPTLVDTGIAWYTCTGDLAGGAGVDFTVGSTAVGAGGSIEGELFVSLGGGLSEFNTGNDFADSTVAIIP